MFNSRAEVTFVDLKKERYLELIVTVPKHTGRIVDCFIHVQQLLEGVGACVEEHLEEISICAVIVVCHNTLEYSVD